MAAIADEGNGYNRRTYAGPRTRPPPDPARHLEKTMTRRILSLVVLTLLGAAPAVAQRDWNAPFPAHHVIDNIYFVGTEQLGTFLITTPRGAHPDQQRLRVDGAVHPRERGASGIRLRRYRDHPGSHAHGDHMEADGLVKALTGAEVMVMRQDVERLRRIRPGGKEHPIDRILDDGDEVTLGGTGRWSRTAPRDTRRDARSWALDVEEAGRSYLALNRVQLRRQPRLHPRRQPRLPRDRGRLSGDLRQGALPAVDVFLGSHGYWYDMERKLERAMSRAEGVPNPFIDRAGYLAHIDMQEQRFLEMLAEQEAAR